MLLCSIRQEGKQFCKYLAYYASDPDEMMILENMSLVTMRNQKFFSGFHILRHSVGSKRLILVSKGRYHCRISPSIDSYAHLGVQQKGRNLDPPEITKNLYSQRSLDILLHFLHYHISSIHAPICLHREEFVGPRHWARPNTTFGKPNLSIFYLVDSLMFIYSN